MTYPEIGNVGVNREDVESRKPFVDGFIVKEYWEPPSNWRAEESLGEYLRSHNLIGISGIDTRALVSHVRDVGAQQGVISTLGDDPDRLVAKAKAAPGLVGRDLVTEVTCSEPYEWTEGRWTLEHGYESAERVSDAATHVVVAYDYGIKQNILRNLERRYIYCLQ